MAKVNLNRTVFDKRKFNQSINTGFSQLTPKEEQKFFDVSLATVDDFFTLYTNLFYEIPKEGENGSHEYLVKESSEYINFEQIGEDIQALLDEITDLREELLALNQENLDINQKLIMNGLGVDPDSEYLEGGSTYRPTSTSTYALAAGRGRNYANMNVAVSSGFPGAFGGGTFSTVGGYGGMGGSGLGGP